MNVITKSTELDDYKKIFSALVRLIKNIIHVLFPLYDKQIMTRIRIGNKDWKFRVTSLLVQFSPRSDVSNPHSGSFPLYAYVDFY